MKNNRSSIQQSNSQNINVLRVICLLGGLVTPFVTFLWKYEYPQMKSSLANGILFSGLFFVILLLTFTNSFVKKHVQYFSYTLFYLSSISGLFFAYLNKFSEGYALLMILVVFSVAWIFNEPINLLIYEAVMFILIFAALIATNKSQMNSVIILSMIAIFALFAYLNLTSKVRIQRKLEYLSYHDKLTGIYNRAFFEETLRTIEEQKTLPIGLIIGDVNCLKIANDVFGHAVGDQLIISVASILLECSDKESFVCRIGGDEFAVIVPQLDELKIFSMIAKIKELCANETTNPIPPSVALGYAMKTKLHESFDEVFIMAETMMYKNKHSEGENVRNMIIAQLQSNLAGKSIEDIEHRQRLDDLFMK